MTKHLMIGAAATFALTAASAAHASAVYDARASTTLTMTAVTNTTTTGSQAGLEFAVGTGVEGDDTETTGDATAETSFELRPSDADALGLIRNSLALGETLSNTGSVTGVATDGTSSATVLTDGSIFMENLSLTDTFEVTFELTYDMSASTGIEFDGESASATSFVQVDTELLGATGTLTEGGVVSEVLSGTVLSLALEPVQGDEALSASASILLTFVLSPGTAVNMFMFADAEGNAIGIADVDMDVVPLPGALGFMLFGAAGLAGMRRRAARA